MTDAESGMRLVWRRLTRDEARRIHVELKTTPNILGYTVGELLAQRRMVVAEVSGQMVGVCFNTDLPLGWTEIAALYVLPECRSRGTGRALFDAAWDEAESRGRHLLVLSRNPRVIEWMREKGMRVEPANGRIPLAYHLYGLWYMAHPYRNWEAFRKLPQMLRSSRMMYGVKLQSPRPPEKA